MGKRRELKMMEEVFTELHRYCYEENWSRIDMILEALRIDPWPTIMRSGALRATAPQRHRLKEWERLYCLVEKSDASLLTGIPEPIRRIVRQRPSDKLGSEWSLFEDQLKAGFEKSGLFENTPNVPARERVDIKKDKLKGGWTTEAGEDPAATHPQTEEATKMTETPSKKDILKEAAIETKDGFMEAATLGLEEAFAEQVVEGAVDLAEEFFGDNMLVATALKTEFGRQGMALCSSALAYFMLSTGMIPGVEGSTGKRLAASMMRNGVRTLASPQMRKVRKFGMRFIFRMNDLAAEDSTYFLKGEIEEARLKEARLREDAREKVHAE